MLEPQQHCLYLLRYQQRPSNATLRMGIPYTEGHRQECHTQNLQIFLSSYRNPRVLARRCN